MGSSVVCRVLAALVLLSSVGAEETSRCEDDTKNDWKPYLYTSDSSEDHSRGAPHLSAGQGSEVEVGYEGTASSVRSETRGCRAAVCVSGQWRSFAQPQVRKLFRENLVGGLSGEIWHAGKGASVSGGRQPSFSDEFAGQSCAVDIFFFAKTTDYVSKRSEFFRRTAAAPTSEASIREVVATEFPDSRLRVVSGDDPLPNGTANAPPVDPWVATQQGTAWPSLRSVSACFEMVQEAEAEASFRYDWVVKTRFDLAYLWPLPPLPAFDPLAMYVPYSSVPISDVFAVCPRSLASAYFQADELVVHADFPGGGGGSTEEVLLAHLLASILPNGARAPLPPGGPACRSHRPSSRGSSGSELKVRLYDFPLAIVRTGPNDSKCQGLCALRFPCILVGGARGWAAPFDSIDSCLLATTLATANLCDNLLGDGGRGPQLKQALAAAAPPVAARWKNQKKREGESRRAAELLPVERVMVAFLQVEIRNLASNHPTAADAAATSVQPPGARERRWAAHARAAARTLSDPTRVVLPALHTATLGFANEVKAAAAAEGRPAPREMSVKVHQRPEETLMGRLALACTFARHLAASPFAAAATHSSGGGGVQEGKKNGVAEGDKVAVAEVILNLPSLLRPCAIVSVAEETEESAMGRAAGLSSSDLAIAAAWHGWSDATWAQVDNVTISSLC